MDIWDFQGVLGMVTLIALAWIFSEQRRKVRVGMIFAAIALQFLIAVSLLWFEPMRNAILSLNAVVRALQSSTEAGATFVFGFLGGGAPPYEVTDPSNSTVLAFGVFPLIIVLSALSALLWHWRILPIIVNAFAFIFQRTLGIGGAVGLGTAANIFVGMIEAPLLIRPYLTKLSRGELFIVLTTGLATVAGTVLVLYAAILSDTVPGALGHILTASIINVPAAIMIARIMVPSDDVQTASTESSFKYENTMDALATGTQNGLQIMLGVVAMLLVFVALMALGNNMLTVIPDVAGAPLTIERLLGWAFAPVVWLIGIPWEDAMVAGSLMGLKTTLTEFVAYLALASTPEDALQDRSRLMLVYAMCGFASPAGVGIMVGGVTALVPERRAEVLELSVKALFSGTMATLMTGSVIGIITALGGV